MVVVGFFFGWLGFRGHGGSLSVSGWQIANLAKRHGLHYLLIYLLPVGAVVSALLAIKDPKKGGNVAMYVGGAFLLWSVVEVIRVLYTTTFFGLWLTVAGCATLLIVGVKAASEPS